MASRKRYRYTFEVVFFSEGQKAEFSERVESARRKLEGERGGVRLSNVEFFSHLLGMAESGNLQSPVAQGTRS